MKYIIGFIITTVIIAVFPSVRAWIEGGTEGLREYKKQKREEY